MLNFTEELHTIILSYDALDLSIQGPPQKCSNLDLTVPFPRTCSNLFNLDLTVPGPNTRLPLPHYPQPWDSVKGPLV